MRHLPAPALVAASLAASLLALGAARTAHAVGEDEKELAAMVGAARLAGAGVADGVLARLEGQFGLSDVLALHGAVGSSWHRLAGQAVRATSVTAGGTYAVDVLRVVPFAEAGICFLDQSGVGRRHLGIEVGVGGEYLIDRRWAVALVGRAAYLPVRLSGAGDAASLLGVGLRLGYLF
jgi:hypothetical protein